MADKSGFDISDAINSSSVNPGRFSHFGLLPAPGASRLGVDDGGSTTDAKSWVLVLEDCCDDGITNPVAVETTANADVNAPNLNFIVERLTGGR